MIIRSAEGYAGHLPGGRLPVVPLLTPADIARFCAALNIATARGADK